MKKIAELIGRELKWEQPSTLKMEYELRADEELAATLCFKNSFGSFATAASADGTWTFKRVGFWQTRATIRSIGANIDLAVFKNNTWSGGGTLEFPDGRKYLANTNFWQTHYEFKTEAGESLFAYRNIGGVLHASSHVRIEPCAAAIAELPWVVMLGWYLIVMMQQDAAVAAV
ncbi:MAG: hypothetical protein HZB51_01565 [Chloroflexi bacterium]|nr:hypothetical protein [Chloroflexota bacterium]